MFSRIRMFNRNNSVSSSYGTMDLSESRESSSDESTESSCFRDSNSTQRAISVYIRYRECIGDQIETDYPDTKEPRVWTSETGEILEDSPVGASHSSDKEIAGNLSSSNRSSLSSLTDKHGDFENIDDDYVHEDPPFSEQQWLGSDNHQDLLKSLYEGELSTCNREEDVLTPTTEPLTPETTSGQTSPARLSPVNTMKRSFISFLRPKEK